MIGKTKNKFILFTSCSYLSSLSSFPRKFMVQYGSTAAVVDELTDFEVKERINGTYLNHSCHVIFFFIKFF